MGLRHIYALFSEKNAKIQTNGQEYNNVQMILEVFALM